jgi:predicted alpha/beta-hydrolase family hydrolase
MLIQLELLTRGTIRGVTTRDVETPYGPARVHLHPAGAAPAGLVLGHGAGGGVGARDLVAAKDAALSLSISVALVEQPYRVAGRRSPPPPRQLDPSWIAVVEHLRADELRDLPLITGGRSSGARVACRTAEATGAAGVLCLAFPLQPPPRAGKDPAPSRLTELDAVAVPVLVVQGDRDPFGMPPSGAKREVAVVQGDHGLKTDLKAVTAAIERWLETVVGQATRAAT